MRAHFGGIIDKNLSELATKKIKRRFQFLAYPVLDAAGEPYRGNEAETATCPRPTRRRSCRAE